MTATKSVSNLDDATTGRGERGLGSEALLRLWGWIWSGIAEREWRIWAHASSAKDYVRERQAVVELRTALLERLTGTKRAVPDGRTFERLTTSRLSPEEATSFEAELADWHRLVAQYATGQDSGRNKYDAADYVLQRARPVVAAIRAGDPGEAQGGVEPGALTPVGAFRFHAWIACRLDALERQLDARAFTPEERARALEALPRERMVHAQWVASLPSARSVDAWQEIYERLRLGVGAARGRAFAGWLRAQADRWSDRQEAFVPALEAYALAGGLTREALFDVAPPGPPPWTPPDPLPKAELLGGLPSAGENVVSGYWNDPPEGENRYRMPLHQFLAAHDRGLK